MRSRYSDISDISDNYNLFSWSSLLLGKKLSLELNHNCSLDDNNIIIPNIIHFIYGLKPQTSSLDSFESDFTLLHALTIIAAKNSLSSNDTIIYFHYLHLPNGKYFHYVKHLLLLKQISHVPTTYYNIPITHIAHQSDILRLQILYEYGGIYLDIDMFIYKPLDSFLHNNVLMGMEEDYGLCNAFIAAAPQSRFIQRWLDNYATFQMVGDKWNFHSVHLPLILANQFPQEICIQPKTFLFYPSYHINHLFLIHQTNGYDFDNPYQIGYHFNEHAARYFAKGYTVDNLKTLDTSFAKLLRPFIPEDWE